MKIQLIRHATIYVQYLNKKILIDPMFSDKGTLDPTPNTPNQKNNPLVDLPVNLEDITKVDAVIVTHLHRDHLDMPAINTLQQDLPIFCQPADKHKLEEHGFTNVNAVKDQLCWEGISIHRTGGQHGTGEIGAKMGPVSGFVLSSPLDSTLYVLGDTVWCDEVEQALTIYTPDVAVVFAGAATFLEGEPITMTKENIHRLCYHNDKTTYIIAHMEAWNHCLLSRNELKAYAQQNSFENRILIPQDGDWVY